MDDEEELTDETKEILKLMHAGNLRTFVEYQE